MERAAGDQAAQEKACSRWFKDAAKLHLRKISDRFAGNPRSSASVPRVLILGKHMRRVRTDQQLFPCFTGPICTSRLRGFPRHLGCGRAKRLGSRGVRRRAARAIFECGGSFAELLREGQWHSSGYRRFRGPGIEKAAAMARVPIEASGEAGSGRERPRGRRIPLRPKRV